MTYFQSIRGTSAKYIPVLGRAGNSLRRVRVGDDDRRARAHGACLDGPLPGGGQAQTGGEVPGHKDGGVQVRGRYGSRPDSGAPHDASRHARRRVRHGAGGVRVPPRAHLPVHAGRPRQVPREASPRGCLPRPAQRRRVRREGANLRRQAGGARDAGAAGGALRVARYVARRGGSAGGGRGRARGAHAGAERGGAGPRVHDHRRAGVVRHGRLSSIRRRPERRAGRVGVQRSSQIHGAQLQQGRDSGDHGRVRRGR